MRSQNSDDNINDDRSDFASVDRFLLDNDLHYNYIEGSSLELSDEDSPNARHQTASEISGATFPERQQYTNIFDNGNGLIGESINHDLESCSSEGSNSLELFIREGVFLASIIANRQGETEEQSIPDTEPRFVEIEDDNEYSIRTDQSSNSHSHKAVVLLDEQTSRQLEDERNAAKVHIDELQSTCSDAERYQTEEMDSMHSADDRKLNDSSIDISFITKGETGMDEEEKSTSKYSDNKQHNPVFRSQSEGPDDKEAVERSSSSSTMEPINDLLSAVCNGNSTDNQLQYAVGMQSLPETSKASESRLLSPSNASKSHHEEDANVNAAHEMWNDLNLLLQRKGLGTIQLVLLPHLSPDVRVPDSESLMNIVQDITLQLEKKDQAIQGLITDLNRNARSQKALQDSIKSIAKEKEDSLNSLSSIRLHVRRLQEENKVEKQKADEEIKKLKLACRRLREQLNLSEHRVKCKEVLAERLKEKLQEQTQKEKQRKARDQTLFHTLKQRRPRSMNIKDVEALGYMRTFADEREQLQEEIELLRAHVAECNAENRDKDNYIARNLGRMRQPGRMKTNQTSERIWISDSEDDQNNSSYTDSRHRSKHCDVDRSRHMYVSDELLERLEKSRRDQEKAAATLRRREAAMQQRTSALQEELRQAHGSIHELKDENANLILEAESRPSIRDYRLCQRRIHQLETQLSESKLAIHEAQDLNELRKYMSTKELMACDRLNRKLHLNRLGSLPRDTLLQVVKNVCRILNLSDITMISPSLENLCTVVLTVPRMEKFIRDVCGFFHPAGDTCADEHDGSLEIVLTTLEKWKRDLERLKELESFRKNVISELCKRSTACSLDVLRDDQLGDRGHVTSMTALRMVAQLVEVEQGIVDQERIYHKISDEVKQRPDLLVNQIIRHILQLFQIRSIDGILPMMNQVYLFVNEMESFLTVARQSLNMPDKTSVASCLTAIQICLHPSAEDTNTKDKGDDTIAAKDANYVVENRLKVNTTPIAGVQTVREMTILIQHLKRELGAKEMNEILPKTRRLIQLLGALTQ